MIQTHYFSALQAVPGGGGLACCNCSSGQLNPHAAAPSGDDRGPEGRAWLLSPPELCGASGDHALDTSASFSPAKECEKNNSLAR